MINKFMGFVFFILSSIFYTTYAPAVEFRPYIQASPGLYFLDLELFNNTSQTSMLGGFVGAGVEFYPWLALEARAGGSMVDSGTLANNKYNAQVQFPLLSVFAKPILPLEDWYLYGLVGATVTPEYTLTSGSGATSTTKKTTSLSLGIGAGYQISDAWSVNIEGVVYHSKIGASNTLNAKLNGVGLTFNYYFDVDDSPDEAEVKVVEGIAPKPRPVRAKLVFEQHSTYFRSNSAKLSPAAIQQLDQLEVRLQEYKTIKLRIEGYSDASGPEGYNLWLSAQRAASVESYLLKKGIDGSRLFTMGFGELYPVAVNDRVEGRTKNRRVEVKKEQGQTMPESGQRVLLRGVQFATESSELSMGSQNSLQQLVEILKAHPNVRIQVLGHTDSTGSETYNQMLSEQRASAVTQHLVRQGVNASRLTSVGYGGSVPISNNVTREGRELNRRVEVILRY